jgi:hypothetical protein
MFLSDIPNFIAEGIPTYERMTHMLVNLKKAPYNPVNKPNDIGKRHRLIASAMRGA